MVIIMNIIEYFKNDEIVKNYLEDNRITESNEFTFLDIIKIVKSNPYRLDLLSKYNEYKKHNLITKAINSEFDELFEKEKEDIIIRYPIKSIWNYIDNITDDGYTHKKILRAYINDDRNLINSKYKDVISIYPIERNNLQNTIFFDIIGKVKYRKLDLKMYLDGITYINYNLYINPWVGRKYNNYLHKKNILKIVDLKLYLNENNYEREYTELVNLLLLFEETNKYEKICDYKIDCYLKDNLSTRKFIILKMLVRNVSRNYIMEYGKLSYKNYLKLCNEFNRVLVKYFDSFKGRYVIKYLLSLNDGFFTDKDLQTFYPRTYKYIIYAIKNKLVFGLKYNDEYEIYSSISINSDCEIINKYSKYLGEEEYEYLKQEIKEMFFQDGIVITNELIEKRINKIYKKYHNYYAKGYISTQYKLFNLYMPYIKTGISNIDVFFNNYEKMYLQSIDIKQTIYTYFTKIDNIYYLKTKLINKYLHNDVYFKKAEEVSKSFYDKYRLIYRVAESFKNIFTVNQIAQETYIEKKIVKVMLKKSLNYYQLKDNTFIKSDALILSNEIISFFKSIYKESSKIKYLKTKERYNSFLKYYKIKNEKYLQNIIRKLIKKENKAN